MQIVDIVKKNFKKYLHILQTIYCTILHGADEQYSFRFLWISIIRFSRFISTLFCMCHMCHTHMGYRSKKKRIGNNMCDGKRLYKTFRVSLYVICVDKYWLRGELTAHFSHKSCRAFISAKFRNNDVIFYRDNERIISFVKCKILTF